MILAAAMRAGPRVGKCVLVARQFVTAAAHIGKGCLFACPSQYRGRIGGDIIVMMTIGILFLFKGQVGHDKTIARHGQWLAPGPVHKEAGRCRRRHGGKAVVAVRLFEGTRRRRIFFTRHAGRTMNLNDADRATGSASNIIVVSRQHIKRVLFLVSPLSLPISLTKIRTKT